MSHLADGKAAVSVPVGRNTSAEIAILPLGFNAPVSFEDHPIATDADVITTDDSEEEEPEDTEE